MKMMKKSLLMIAFMFFASVLFAAGKSTVVESTGVTSTDVKSWYSNLNLMTKELEAVGIKKESKVNKKQSVDAIAILNSYGISGNNALEKYNMITKCAGILVAEDKISNTKKKSTALKLVNADPLAKLKSKVSEKDYNVVRIHRKAVVAAVQGISK